MFSHPDLMSLINIPNESCKQMMELEKNIGIFMPVVKCLHPLLGPSNLMSFPFGTIGQ